MTILMTERLALRPLLPADAEAYAEMRFHPEVAKWLPAPSGDPQAADAAIERFTRSWEERRYGPWGVFLEGRLIGHGGLNYVPDFGETEVLWALHPKFWGRGYATEVARAALDFGFGTLGLEMIFAMTLPDNLASQAVMKRIGLTYRKRVTYKGFDAVWYDTNRDLWTAV